MSGQERGGRRRGHPFADVRLDGHENICPAVTGVAPVMRYRYVFPAISSGRFVTHHRPGILRPAFLYQIGAAILFVR